MTGKEERGSQLTEGGFGSGRAELRPKAALSPQTVKPSLLAAILKVPVVAPARR